MIISTSLNKYLSRFSVGNAFSEMKKIGYGACDYGFTGKHSPLENADLNETIFKPLGSIKKAADDNGIKVFQTHAQFFASVDNYDENYIAAYVDYTAKQAEAAEFLGAEYMVVHPVQPYGCSEDKEPERTKELNVFALKEILKKTSGFNVKLALENMPCHAKNVPCSTIKGLLSYIAEAKDERLKICFDTGHANVAQAHTEEADSPAKYAEAFGTEIGCLHIHDNSSAKDEHMLPLTPVYGGINWKELMPALKKIGYKGTFNAENDFSVRFPAELFLTAEKFQYDLFRNLTD